MSAAPLPAPLINAEGTFTDAASWIYKEVNGTFSLGNQVLGTNEKIVLTAPAVQAGQQVVGVNRNRHRMDLHGYPLRISLLDKVFANKFKVDINVSNGEDIYKYSPGNLFAKEARVAGSGTPKYNAFGPIAPDAAIPAQYKPAYDFVIGALKSISNMPEDQRDIARYHLLFIETDDLIWVELGPLWASDEAPHLGCQTKLGRDMVFGYAKKGSKDRSGGPFLQCF